jgi:type IV pilus assembly protein PilY1
MSKLVPNSKVIVQTLLGMAVISMFSSAIAQPAQLPLLSRSGDQGKPNVMFTLDDSGSMELMNMPDEMAWGVRSGGGSISFSHSVRTGFHHSENNVWPWVRNRFISTNADSLVSARWRSSGVNTLYYNPEIRYTPWLQFDGTPLADSVPTAARINAPFTWGGTVDLTGSANVTSTWCTNGNVGCQWQTVNFAPATYYEFDGVNEWSINSFTRVRIMDSTTFNRSGSRVDCATDDPLQPGNKICTQAEEYQNFANWYEYYRKRMLTAIAGTSRAFAEQGNDIRLGWGRINKGGSTVDGWYSSSTLQNGVRDFQGVDRLNYFNWLFAQYGNGGTPLRRAMGQVGKYFQRTDDNGPWSTHPGNGQGADKLACRKSYHILMSDGYWNGATASGGANANVDNNDGPLITGPGVPSYQYFPTDPFMDNNSKTLADVAMYYWNRDLNPALENRVRQDADNPAFWQNLVQFTVGLGVNGTRFPGRTRVRDKPRSTTCGTRQLTLMENS